MRGKNENETYTHTITHTHARECTEVNFRGGEKKYLSLYVLFFFFYINPLKMP